jgi:hypothetical protein
MTVHVGRGDVYANGELIGQAGDIVLTRPLDMAPIAGVEGFIRRLEVEYQTIFGNALEENFWAVIFGFPGVREYHEWVEARYQRWARSRVAAMQQWAHRKGRRK